MREEIPDCCCEVCPNDAPAFLKEKGIVAVRARSFLIRNREQCRFNLFIGEWRGWACSGRGWSGSLEDVSIVFII